MDSDELHARYTDVERAVHELVNRMTKDLNEDDENIVRTKLNEQFRFWRLS